MLRDHYPLIKTEYLRQWSAQGRLSDGARAAIVRESCLLDYEWLRLAVIKIDSYYEISERYDFASQVAQVCNRQYRRGAALHS